MKRNQNFDYNRSQKVLSCRYNMDINRVEARFEDMTMQVSLNYLLLLVAFIGELAITLSVSRGYTQNNLYQIVKGAE